MMSITLELSPELEKQLAAMSEDERTRFVTDAVAEKLVDEEDPAVWAVPPTEDETILSGNVLSPEASELIRVSFTEPVKEPSETLKKALAHWKLLTGYTNEEVTFANFGLVESGSMEHRSR